ncbi:MAG: glycosyltransferase family 4 protein [Deltaproteobacteria bacterium]|nr:glycosyltransferase family 4 protein [Deltaproteobacteria bacterium]
MKVKQNIKVLYFNDWIAGTWQVQKVHAVNFIEAFKKQPGIQLYVYPQMASPKDESIYEEKEKTYLKLIRQFVDNANQPFVKRIIQFLSDKRQLVRINTYLKQVNPDLIIARHNAVNFNVIYNFTKLKQPLVLEVNALVANDLRLENIKVPSRTARLERDIIHRSNAMFAVCRAHAEALKEICGKPDKIFIVPNGVDPVKFSPQPKSKELCEKYGLTNNVVIGYVGGFEKGAHERRDVLGMLEAFKICKMKSQVPFKMLMVGKMDEGYLVEEIKKIGIEDSVVFTGLIDHFLLPQLIDLIDIAVAPYFGKHLLYASPMKVFEYMSMEKPVIIPKIGQPAEILVNKKTAVLVEPESPSSMAEGLLTLIHDASLREKIGSNARKLILNKYTWEHNAKGIADICRLALEKQRLEKKVRNQQ